MKYYRFATDAIGWNPAVNVLLPDDYDSGRTYPVLYLLHGGGTDQDFITFDRMGIRQLTAGRPIIVVMPDGGHAGWYSNPVHSNTGPRNWETFHVNQLRPWIEANFRTFAEYDGRAVAGFSMGGFGALKYAAKYYGHFASVSSHSGPASIRRDGGLVVNWASRPPRSTWPAAPCTACRGMRPGSPRTTRCSGSRATATSASSWSPGPARTRSTSSTWPTRPRCSPVTASSARLLGRAGIHHEWHEEPGGHIFRGNMFSRDLDGIIARLRKA